MTHGRNWIINMDCHAKRRQVLADFALGPEVELEWEVALKYEGICGEYREFDGTLLASWQTGSGIALLAGQRRVVFTEPAWVSVKAIGQSVQSTVTTMTGESIVIEEPLPPNARDNPTFDYLDEITSIFGCHLKDILESQDRIRRYGCGPPND